MRPLGPKSRAAVVTELVKRQDAGCDVREPGPDRVVVRHSPSNHRKLKARRYD